LRTQPLTRVGLEATRTRGRKGGRKKIASNNPKVLTAKCMHKNHGMKISDICKTLNISRASFYQYLSLHEEEHKNL
jgi:phage antirepressor YoqD-like protein